MYAPKVDSSTLHKLLIDITNYVLKDNLKIPLLDFSHNFANINTFCYCCTL